MGEMLVLLAQLQGMESPGAEQSSTSPGPSSLVAFGVAKGMEEAQSWDQKGCSSTVAQGMLLWHKAPPRPGHRTDFHE